MHFSIKTVDLSLFLEEGRGVELHEVVLDARRLVALGLRGLDHVHVLAPDGGPVRGRRKSRKIETSRSFSRTCPKRYPLLTA